MESSSSPAPCSPTCSPFGPRLEAAGPYLRLRIISIVMPAAMVVIIALPGTFPLWMKIEQGVCGLLLIGVAFLVNGKHLRSSFGAK